MTTTELTTTISTLREWEAIAAEAAAQIESLKDELKQFMVSQNLEEYEIGTHIIRYTTVKSNRFDTTSFKKEHLEMYKQYTKLSTSRRFTISG